MAASSIPPPGTVASAKKSLFGAPAAAPPTPDKTIAEQPKLREDIDIEAGYYFHSKKLGEGGFSKVRLATHTATGMQVAIKCMDKSKLGQDLFRVKTEIGALKTLQHDNIAKLYQVIETSTHIFLVLEYCSGGELFDYIVQKHRLSEAESKLIMRSLIRCLAYIHVNGYAHRDLKPENILFDANHTIKLIDFGLAAHPKNNSALLQLKTCCGSPAYAAPELISGLTYSGPAVDVWSAGVLLYALLVGQLPFDDDNISNLYKKIKAGSYLLPTFLSVEARALIRSMLKVNPNQRVTIRELLRNDWINSGQFSPIAVHKEDLSDEVLYETWRHFPRTELAQLRHNVIKGFGYQTATYWLLKKKAKESGTMGLSMYLSPTQVSKVNAKSLETGLEQIKEEVEPSKEQEKAGPTPAKVIKSDHGIASPNPRAATAAASVAAAHLKRKLPEPSFNVYGRESLDTRPPKAGRFTPVKTRAVAARPPTVPVPIRTAPSTPKRASIAGTPTRPIAQRTPLKAPTPRRESLPVAPRPPPQQQQTSPAKKVLSPIDPNKSIKTTYTVLPDKAPASPSATPKHRHLKQLFGLTPHKENTPMPGTPGCKTPLKQPIIMATPQKRSLMKRILAAATPTVTDKPRAITVQTTAKNITMTNFANPAECMAELVKCLERKNFQCKTKGFVINCAKVNKYTQTDMLSFDLEICMFEGKCAILRKRLRGDAWFYKKVCEEILRFSGVEPDVKEDTMGALKGQNLMQAFETIESQV